MDITQVYIVVTIIGLILVAVLLILFCPVRYRASGTKETDSFRDISARARVSWLFGGVSFQLEYKDGNQHMIFDYWESQIHETYPEYLRERKKKCAEKKPLKNGHADT